MNQEYAVTFGKLCLCQRPDESAFSCSEAPGHAGRHVYSDGAITRTSPQAMEIEIFKVNDCEWYAATTADGAIKAAAELVSEPSVEEYRRNYDAFDVPVRLEPEDMQKLKFMDEREDGANGPVRTFREQLDRMIAAGDTFPCFFASTEF